MRCACGLAAALVLIAPAIVRAEPDVEWMSEPDLGIGVCDTIAGWSDGPQGTCARVAQAAVKGLGTASIYAVGDGPAFSRHVLVITARDRSVHLSPPIDVYDNDGMAGRRDDIAAVAVHLRVLRFDRRPAVALVLDARHATNLNRRGGYHQYVVLACGPDDNQVWECMRSVVGDLATSCRVALSSRGRVTSICTTTREDELSF